VQFKLVVVVSLVLTGFGNISAFADIFDLGKLSFQNLQVFDKLESRTITALAEDDQGFIWVGTQYGLIRYDGYRLREFRHDANQPETSIAGNFITALWVSDDGRLWIATNSDGLAVFDSDSGRFHNYRHQDGETNSLSSNQIKALTGDKHGGIWIGTNNGLDYLDTNSGQFTHYSHRKDDATSLSDNYIRSLLIDNNGDLWIGSWDGLNRRKAGADQFERIASDPKQEHSLAGNNVFSLLQAEDNKIWIGTTAKGAAFLSPDKLQLAWLPEQPSKFSASRPLWIHKMIQVSAHEIWLATNGEGILIVNAETGKILRHIRHDATFSHSINDDSVSALLLDQSGLLWLGTWGNGINLFNPHNQTFRNLHHSLVDEFSLSQSDIRSSLELKNGNIWLGTKGNGIDIINPSTAQLTGLRPDPSSTDSLPDSPVTALAQTADLTVWIGTRDAGLYAYHPATASLKRYVYFDNNSLPVIHRILPGAGGKLWIASDAGLLQFTPSTETFRRFTTADQPTQEFNGLINALGQQADGTLWIGTNDGLYALAAGSEQLVHFKHRENQPDSLSHNFVAGLLVDSHDKLWVSTDQGLDRLTAWNNQAAHFESINQKVEQPDQLPFGNLLEDHKGRIWGSESLLDPQSWQQNAFKPGDGAIAIGGWVGAYSKTRGGIFIFAGNKGILLVKPESLTVWDFQPPIVISESSLNSVPVHIKDSLTLPPLSKGFSIEFSALDFISPETLQYTYFLEGFDNNKISTDAFHRVASYTNLSPGHYVLHVKATNSAGNWGKRELTLPVWQQAAWYQHLWLKLLAVVFVLLLIIPAIKWRQRQLQKRQNQLEKLIDERTRELELKNRELEQASLTDQMTTAKNRRFVDKFMHQEIARLERSQGSDDNHNHKSLSFLMIDIDKFKSINDHYGHKAGDMVLIEFVRILHGICRESDWIIRWGGEEFLVIMREQQQENAQQLAERIRSTIEQHAFSISHAEPINITCSIGLASFPFFRQHFHTLSWEQTLNIADVALYMAKQQGRNRWINLLGLKHSSVQTFYRQFINDPQCAIELGEVLCLRSASTAHKLDADVS
jgi:diguanylate cyclase (GGDEF)-like protein